MVRPLCMACGNTPADSRGNGKWHKKCTSCRRKPYRMHKGSICVFCGFVPIHMSQLDVDHIDGNHKNNDLSNLQTLCANCHRLKTVMSGDCHNRQGDH